MLITLLQKITKTHIILSYLYFSTTIHAKFFKKINKLA